MDNIERKPLDEYTYRIVTESAVNCSCGKVHEAGDVLWGGEVHPDEQEDGVDWMEAVREIHDGEFRLHGPDL